MDSNSIAHGSVIQFTASILKTNSSTANDGIVIANPGQLVWHRRSQRSITFESWYALERPYAVSPGMKFGPGNSIPRNANSEEHIECVFEDVIAPLANRGCKLNIIAIGGSAVETVEYLQRDWLKWKDAVQAIAIGSGHVWQSEFIDNDFKEFFGKVSGSLQRPP